jgi:hypothetical protein
MWEAALVSFQMASLSSNPTRKQEIISVELTAKIAFAGYKRS